MRAVKINRGNSLYRFWDVKMDNSILIWDSKANLIVTNIKIIFLVNVCLHFIGNFAILARVYIFFQLY